MKPLKKIPSATPPVEEEKIKVKKQSATAGGIPAVVVAASHVFKEMNIGNCFPALFSVNQMGGFDCPGCAWPDPSTHRSKLGEYCENGAKAIAEEATEARVTPDFFQRFSISELAELSDYNIGKSGRLTHPMILREGKEHYEPITWEEAFEIIAQELNALESPDEAVFYTSGRTSNEAAFLYQLFVREYGTNNMPDCSNMCHESSGVGLSETVGIGKGSVMLEDFYLADLILVIGQNPGTNHPRMLTALQKAKKAGARIISINPLKEAGLSNFKNPQEITGWFGKGTTLSDIHLQVRINEDVALLKAIMLLMAEEEEKNPGSVFDHEFIAEHTYGLQEFLKNLKNYDLEFLSKKSGISVEAIREVSEEIIRHKKIIVCWAMGLTQHKNGVDNIREIVNLLLLKGSIGRPGAGTCPVRGHSNVQGDRTMGIWEAPKQEFLDKLKENFNFEPPRHHGYNTVQAIKAMAEGKAKFFFAMGGNFLSATPDTEYTAKALRNTHMTVHVSTKLNRSHLITGKRAIILPCLGRTEKDVQATGEQFVTVENSMGIVHSSQGKLKPASPHLLSEPQIVCRLAMKVLKNTKTDWQWYGDNYDRIRDAIEKTIPGFESYNRRVREPAGFYLPNGARERKFTTASGKAHFTVNAVSDLQLDEDEYLMMTIRSHDQFNTTIYGLNDRYRGIANGRRVVLINEEDMKKAGLTKGEFVNLISRYDGVERTAPHFMALPYDIPQRCIATYFPEANILVPYNHFAYKSETPISKSVVVKMEKI